MLSRFLDVLFWGEYIYIYMYRERERENEREIHGYMIKRFVGCLN